MIQVMSAAVLKSKIQKKKIVFDDMIANVISHKKIYHVVTELYIRVRKVNIPIVFITLLYFQVLTKGYKTNHYTLLYYGDSKQVTATTNCC